MYVKWFQVQEILLIQTEYISNISSKFSTFYYQFFPKFWRIIFYPLIKFSIGKFLYNSSLKKY